MFQINPIQVSAKIKEIKKTFDISLVAKSVFEIG